MSKAQINSKIFDVLACPLCKSSLHYDKTVQELICCFDRLAFPIRDGIPVMLVDEARAVSFDQIKKIKKKK
jgi:uncharacterized protein